MKLPNPSRLGLPRQFTEWRKYQSKSVLRLLDSTKRFRALVQPTGSGKSAIYAAFLRLSLGMGGKAVILTSTKSLQDQLTRDFGSLGWADMRGQSNYPCAIEPLDTVDLGPCHAGYSCDLRKAGCAYFDALRGAIDAEVTITNYAWWLHYNKYSERFPPIDILICDEFHAAPDELADFLSATITEEQVNKFLGRYPPPTDRWTSWAKDRALYLEGEIESLKLKARTDKPLRRSLRSAKMLLLKLNRLAEAPSEQDWVMERGRTYGRNRQWYYRWDPVWPGPYSEALFRNTPIVIGVSATMRPKTLALLNLRPNDYDFQETPSTFPIANRQIIHYTGQPRVALTYRSDDATLQAWLLRIDNIIRRRLDRKGIIHCVSYARRDFLLRNSQFAEHFIIHDSGQQAEAVARFKAAPPPAIFLSPSATTGLDFPDDECRYQIIAKVPFPDLRSKILQARAKADRDYSMYLTMLDVVQAAGRAVRSDTDWAECFIVDDNWQWFLRKYEHFAPQWFLEACRRADRIPSPPSN